MGSFFEGLFGGSDKKKKKAEPLVLGAKLKCPYGEHESFLFVKSSTIDIDNLPEACVTDNKALYNILPFGSCYMGTDCQNIMEIEEEWENKEKQTKKVNGKEIITTESTLRCNFSGMLIEVLTSGQNGDFAEQLLFLDEMDKKYPGLRALLEDPYGSLYLEDGKYEMAIEFLSDMMKERGGKIDLFGLDGKNFKDMYIKAAIERLIPSCDVREPYRMLCGLENTITRSGVKNDADPHYLDKYLMEVIKVDCKDYAKKVKDIPFFKWQEENKRGLSWAAEATTSMAYAAIAYASTYGGSKKSSTKSSESEGAGGANDDVVTYRRVQGGSGTKSSQPRISVDETGKVSIPNKNKNLNISVDGGEHSAYFKGNRLGADVVEFDVPKWLDDFVNESAVPQTGYKSNPLSQGGTAPKITDVTTPGKSIEFPSPWVEWIEEYATNGRVIKGGP